MPKPGEHKTVQSRILNYAQEIGWTFVPRSDAEQRRGFNSEGGTIGEQAANASLYFDDLLHSKAREFNPKYNEAKGGLTGRLTCDALLPELDEELQDYVIVHELLHSRIPNHGKLWKSLMRVHAGDSQNCEKKLNEIGHPQKPPKEHKKPHS